MVYHYGTFVFKQGVTQAQIETCFAEMRGMVGKRGQVADLNGDGIVNSLDIGPFTKRFGKAPGPSGLHLDSIAR